MSLRSHIQCNESPMGQDVRQNPELQQLVCIHLCLLGQRCFDIHPRTGLPFTANHAMPGEQHSVQL